MTCGRECVFLAPFFLSRLQRKGLTARSAGGSPGAEVVVGAQDCSPALTVTFCVGLFNSQINR